MFLGRFARTFKYRLFTLGGRARLASVVEYLARAFAPTHVRSAVDSIGQWSAPRARCIALVVVLAVATTVHHAAEVGWRGSNATDALARVLRSRGLSCESQDISWVIGPKGITGAIGGGSRALVRAHLGDDPSDLYWVDARLAREGQLLEVGDVWKLTDTVGADESRPIVRGHVAAYVATADGVSTGVHVLDLDGRSLRAYDDFTRTQRVEVALTNLEQAGQINGVVHDSYAFDPVTGPTELRWLDDGRLAAHAEDRDVTIDPHQGRVTEGGEFVRVVRDERTRPGNVVTWAVDRVRALSWFGEDRMQWLKAMVFTALDQVHARFTPDTTVEQVRDDLGIRPSDPSPIIAPVGESGFPPPPMKPAASSPLPGEGQWISLDHDPFITRSSPGAEASFAASYLRPDPHRSDVRVYVTLWDPRQVALHMQSGTVEPVSASGECGLGVVPRSPSTMKRVVAAFNGGFQARHGEFGMQVDGVEYLPPKPYAATVMELADGSDAFGAWPGPEARPATNNIVSFRQNLTALVQDGRFNPWQRSWWGGTPPGWPDRIHTTRSGICLTTEGFVGYFYGANIAVEDLGTSMLSARCTFGIQLDMNPGHVGFEFYSVAPAGTLPPIDHPLRPDWEAEGRVPDMPDLEFRARRMLRSMGGMMFPRYLQRQSRDFFYLTARPTLPGTPIDGGGGATSGDGVWRTSGLPQYGHPHAVAVTSVCTPRRDAGDPAACTRLQALRADPRTLELAPSSGSASEASLKDPPTILAFSTTARGPKTLWWSDGVLSLDNPAPKRRASGLLSGVAMTAPAATTATAAVGVQDGDGFLAWVELAPDVHPDAQTAAAMDQLLGQLGCPPTSRLALPGESRAILGGTLDVTGEHPATPAAVVSRLIRGHAPDAHLVFGDTPIVPFEVWQPLQAKRVRYFAKAPPSRSRGAPRPSQAGDTTTDGALIPNESSR